MGGRFGSPVVYASILLYPPAVISLEKSLAREREGKDFDALTESSETNQEPVNARLLIVDVNFWITQRLEAHVLRTTPSEQNPEEWNIRKTLRLKILIL